MEKKKIKKSIESLEKQKQEHRAKIEDYAGKNYALLDYRKQNKTNFIFCPINSFNIKSFWYWEKEINSFDNKINELKRRLEEKS
ncbi:hypothetical protein J4218_00405 [Candidatus Pacearchaeota archaeon]|nr:hypothetical protein [Candidatus Pacearchaeota archaeon]